MSRPKHNLKRCEPPGNASHEEGYREDWSALGYGNRAVPSATRRLLYPVRHYARHHRRNLTIPSVAGTDDMVDTARAEHAPGQGLEALRRRVAELQQLAQEASPQRKRRVEREKRSGSEHPSALLAVAGTKARMPRRDELE